jgi:hypothetical protein
MGNKVLKVCTRILETTASMTTFYGLQEVVLPEDKIQLGEYGELVEKEQYGKLVERLTKSSRRHETFAPSNHEWRRNIGSAYRLENRGKVTDVHIRNELRRKGNYKPKHSVSIIDEEDIFGVIPEVVPEVCISPLSSYTGEENSDKEKKADQFTQEIQEFFQEEIKIKSASLPRTSRDNLLYGICREDPDDSHYYEHLFSHEKE